MSPILTIGCILLVIILFSLFARSTAREARRVTQEVDFRVESINTLIQSIEADDEKAVELERKAARLKARAEEIASRQTPAWKLYSHATRKVRTR